MCGCLCGSDVFVHSEITLGAVHAYIPYILLFMCDAIVECVVDADIVCIVL